MNKLRAMQPPEVERFAELVTVVDQGKKAFVEVGLALAELKQRKLYREHVLPKFNRPAENFEEFCQEMWGWTRQNAVKMIGAAAVVDQLPDKAAALVDSVRAATALSEVPENLREAVIQEISASGKKVSEGEVRKASKNLPKKKKKGKAATPPALPPSEEPPAAPPPKSKPKKLRFVADETGLAVPQELIMLWDRAGEVKELRTYTVSIRTAIYKLQEAADKGNADPLWAEVDLGETMGLLTRVYTLLGLAIPHAVCPDCNGKVTKGCVTCKERGLVSEFFWKTCVTEEARAMRTKAVEDQYAEKK